MQVVTTPVAEADIEGIGDRIAARSPMAAVKFVRKLRVRAEDIGVLPHGGAPRPQWGLDVRIVILGKYLIIHRVRDETVQVLRVLHGARDIDALLVDEPLPE